MIGVYLSGTGNTKHCVEKLVHLMDETAQLAPLEDPQVKSILEKEDMIVLGYPTQFSNAPFMVRDFIKKMALYGEGRSCFWSILWGCSAAMELAARRDF